MIRPAECAFGLCFHQKPGPEGYAKVIRPFNSPDIPCRIREGINAEFCFTWVVLYEGVRGVAAPTGANRYVGTRRIIFTMQGTRVNACAYSIGTLLHPWQRKFRFVGLYFSGVAPRS
jgi:hypothetical protein